MENKSYINLYITNNKIEFQSVQKTIANGNATFELFTVDGKFVFLEEITSEGDFVHNVKQITTFATKPNNAAIKWACIFSSYLACMAISAGVGAAGSLISGPFGAAAGFACRYVFQTLVEKYGIKNQ